MPVTIDMIESLIRRIIAQQTEIWQLQEFDLRPILEDGASSQTIERVESFLQIQLPPSYAVFLHEKKSL